MDFHWLRQQFSDQAAGGISEVGCWHLVGGTLRGGGRRFLSVIAVVDQLSCWRQSSSLPRRVAPTSRHGRRGCHCRAPEPLTRYRRDARRRRQRASCGSVFLLFPPATSLCRPSTTVVATGKKKKAAGAARRYPPPSCGRAVTGAGGTGCGVAAARCAGIPSLDDGRRGPADDGFTPRCGDGTERGPHDRTRTSRRGSGRLWRRARG